MAKYYTEMGVDGSFYEHCIANGLCDPSAMRDWKNAFRGWMPLHGPADHPRPGAPSETGLKCIVPISGTGAPVRSVGDAKHARTVGRERAGDGRHGDEDQRNPHRARRGAECSTHVSVVS